jgi:hypothetical protein
MGDPCYGKTRKHFPSGIPTTRESKQEAEFGGGLPPLFDAWEKIEII